MADIDNFQSPSTKDPTSLTEFPIQTQGIIGARVAARTIGVQQLFDAAMNRDSDLRPINHALRVDFDQSTNVTKLSSVPELAISPFPSLELTGSVKSNDAKVVDGMWSVHDTVSGQNMDLAYKFTPADSSHADQILTRLTDANGKTFEIMEVCGPALGCEMQLSKNGNMVATGHTEFQDPEGAPLVIFDTKLFSAIDGSPLGKVQHTEVGDELIFSVGSAKK